MQYSVRLRNGSAPQITAKQEKKYQLLSFLFLPISMLFIEWTALWYLFGFSFNLSLLYTFLSSQLIGFLALFIAGLLPKKAQFVFSVVFLGLMAAFYSFHIVYYEFFHSFFTLNTLGFADALTQFWRSTLMAIAQNIHKIATMFLPMLLLLFFFKKQRYQLPERFGFRHLLSAAVTAVAAAIFFAASFIPKEPHRVLLYLHNDMSKTFQTFGISVTSVDDLIQTLFGSPEEEIDNPYENSSEVSSEPESSSEPENSSSEGTESEPEPIVYGDNILPIDFEALKESAPNNTIKSMHEYFSSVPATKQNEYTGYFKGKNLICLCLEGFSDKVIDPVLTPTLYKMATEGFCFHNFYDSLWGGSTATGEYTNMTGNFYDSAACLKMSASTLTYSSLGNLFTAADYSTYAYHNHTYTYYGRDISHPAFGYDYKGVGNGLNLPSKCWPASDLEMAQVTAQEYIQQSLTDHKPFHAYYMTVSGHANYTFTGNGMSTRHKDVVQNLDHSDNIRAYYACQYEVELMLRNLIEQLSDAGILEDTVFAMCCDHYPYALSDSELAELYGLPENGIRSNLDLYRNGFILWSACMEEPVNVETPCSSYDIVPTLANLFGLSYDSRLITGKDILSDEENIAIVNTLDVAGNWNWITTEGTYYVASGTFAPSASCTKTGAELEEYVNLTKRKVAAMRKYSYDILNNDYYRYVFNKDFQPLKTLAE